MTKQVKISEENHKSLQELKQKGNYKSLDEVITQLLMINQKYEQGKTVRVIYDDIIHS